jgi:hypothetical protein
VKQFANLRAHGIASFSAAVIGGLLVSSSLMFPQSASKCPVIGTPQVSHELASVENLTKRSVYRRGERISVKLILRAGPRGALLPDFFGPFLQTCRHGFAAAILNLNGRSADPNPTACASAGPTPPVTHVELHAGETRTWSADLPTASIAPGHYCLYAEYLNSEAEASSGLPKEKAALIARGHIAATPIPIKIH